MLKLLPNVELHACDIPKEKKMYGLQHEALAGRLCIRGLVGLKSWDHGDCI